MVNKLKVMALMLDHSPLYLFCDMTGMSQQHADCITMHCLQCFILATKCRSANDKYE